ncbi:MAG: HlyD family type I secretion periplasmic adaptor subunit, partial [Oceanicaulis sp.]|nr:HlyD family type I secretion periplasmic adaptor subunit [Oceanicaulis sp.]
LSRARREYDATLPLLASGAVSEVDILRLERDISQIEGEISQAQARAGALEAAIKESASRIQESDISFRNAWRTELSEALARSRMLEDSGSRLADMVGSTEVRAPVNGVVQRLFFNTLGGVVPSGREVAEIVPLGDQLVVEARILPPDVAFLRPGLQAMVKLSAYDFTVFGGLQATLEHISADTITDERDNTYYLVRVRTDEDANANSAMDIIPGMTAQVDILTGKRTVLEYLLKPVLRATSNAMGER